MEPDCADRMLTTLRRKHLRYIRDQRATKGEILDDGLEVSITVESFRDKLGKWRVAQTKLMPNWEELIAPDTESAADDDDEDEERELSSVLGLPSDIEECDRAEYELNKVADHELTIRVGLAFDQLDGVRLAVQYRAAHLEHKKKNVRGKKANAQAEIEISRAEKRARLLGSRYNDNISRIVALRGTKYKRDEDTTPGKWLQAINLDKDLAISSMATPRSLGESTRVGSWIWSVGDPPASSSAATTRSGQAKVNADKISFESGTHAFTHRV